MDTVVLVLMLLIAFNFLLKQTFWKTVGSRHHSHCCRPVCRTDVAVCHRAIENTDCRLLGNTADAGHFRFLTIEVSLQDGLCPCWPVHVASAYPVKPRTLLTYRFLRWFPGLLIFPVLFSGLVYLIFAFPGTPFTTVAWMYAACVLIAIPVGRWLLLYLFRRRSCGWNSSSSLTHWWPFWELSLP